ncbi:MAG: SulP family inorganic anion transporter [Bacteroidia bacterium]
MKETNDLHVSGFKGLIHNWRRDLVAGLSVSLVALPLSLGVAIASGAPPMAGLIAAMVGGIFTTFIRSGHVAINGPTASLIVVTLFAMGALSDPGTANGFQYVTAAFMCAGGIQLLFGVFRLGKYGNFFPSSVVQGMLAAIGVIIFASQIHVGLGVPFKGSPLESLKAIPSSLSSLHPFVTIIFFNSLFILARHPYVKSRFVKFIPGPMWVLLTSIPLFLLFQYLSDGEVEALGDLHMINTEFLVNLPANVIDGFSIRPNFDKIGNVDFWIAVLSIFLISTIETVLSAKAIDKLDPYKRKTNLNHDLGAVGISTMVSGFLGGLPVLAVIVRSSVNINHGARTRFSNFYHGLFILAFVFLMSQYIQMVPLAALAAILVYSGYKLASPKVFKDASLKGYEQLLILINTLLFTILTDLIWGIVIGVLFTLLLHLIRSSLPPTTFLRYILNPNFSVSKIDSHFHVKAKGVANFASVLKLEKKLKRIPEKEQVIFDFSHSRLVDYSILEYVNDWGLDHENERSGSFSVLGLDEHLTTSDHPFSLHVLPPLRKKRLSKRQKELEELSNFNKWDFIPDLNWKTGRLKQNSFFLSRPIEYSKNKIKGTYKNGLHWEINDITFDEGALMAAEVHHATMLRIVYDQNIPDFTLEHEKLFDRLLDLASKEDINLGVVDSFDTSYSLKGRNKEEIKKTFNKELQIFLKNEERYHIESQNNIILIFRFFRLLNSHEINQMLRFGSLFTEQLHKLTANPADNP